MASRNEQLSRADQVRARRKLEPAHRKPIPRTAQHAQREAESSARVIARRAPSGTAQPSGSKARPQRRIYLPTSTPGSEIRLPAVPEVKDRLAAALDNPCHRAGNRHLHAELLRPLRDFHAQLEWSAAHSC